MDSNLLSVRGEIDMVQLRFDQLTEELGSKASRQIFDDVARTWSQFKTASARGDKEGSMPLSEELDGLLTEGASA